MAQHTAGPKTPTMREEMYHAARGLVGPGYVPDYYEQVAADFIFIAEGHSAELLAALKEFMSIWGSRDSNSASKRAQKRRADMWAKANAAIAKAEGRA